MTRRGLAITSGGELGRDRLRVGAIVAAMPPSSSGAGDRIAVLVVHGVVHASLLGHVRHLSLLDL
jgi:hypothetical protein